MPTQQFFNEMMMRSALF